MSSPLPPPVVVATFRSLAEAQVARSAVETAGIEAVLLQEQSAGFGRFYSGNLGGVGLLVPAADAERALEILDGLWPDETNANEEDEEEPERCPECGSHEFLRIRRLPFFLAFTLILAVTGEAVGQRDLFWLVIAIVAVLLAAGPNRRCTSCGARWRSWRSAPRPPEPPPVEPPDVPCPRCGSVETGPIYRRRQHAMTLLVNFILPPLLLIWPFLPKRRCDDCGFEWR